MFRPLRELVSIEYGKSPNGVREDQGKYPIYGSGGLVGYTNKKLFDKDGIVVARKGTLDKPIYVEDAYWVIDTAYAVLPNENVYPKWLYYCLNNFDLTRLNEATGVPSISRDFLYRVRFYTPDFDDQKKIAKILTIADNLIEKTQILIDKYTAIKQGMMADLFTRGIDLSGTPDTNPNYGQLRPSYEQAPELYKQTELGWVPNEWEICRLSDHISKIDSGWSPVCENDISQPDEWAVLKTTAVVWGGYEESENKKLPGHLNGLPRIEVKEDDLLVTRKGPMERVGVVVHVERTRSKLMFPDTVFRFRVNQESNILPRYMALSLSSHSVQSQWEARKIGLAEAQVNINHGIVNSTLIIRPGVKEQEACVSKIDVITGTIKTMTKLLSKYQFKKKGLMQDLLTGKVKVE